MKQPYLLWCWWLGISKLRLLNNSGSAFCPLPSKGALNPGKSYQKTLFGYKLQCFKSRGWNPRTLNQVTTQLWATYFYYSHAYKLKRWLKSRWVAQQEALRWNVCFCLMHIQCSFLWPFWVAPSIKGRVKQACFNLYEWKAYRILTEFRHD